MKRKLVTRKKLPNSEDEKYILAFSIMHTNVCETLYQYWKDKQLKPIHLTSVYKRQYRSVIKFFEKYGVAPRRTIKFMHEGEKAQLRSTELELDTHLLSILAQEYRSAREGYKVSPKYVISEMIPRFIRSRKVEEITQKLSQSVDSGNIDEAESMIVEYNQVTSEPPDYNYGFTEPLTLDYHIDLIEKNKQEGTKEVYRFDPRLGAIGSLIGPLKRQWVMSVSGSTKSGKSYFLLDMGIDAAIMHKRKVMYLCPEMSEEDMVEERIVAWITERSTSKELAGLQYVPYFDCINNQTCQCQVLSKLPNPKPLIHRVGEGFTSISANERVCLRWVTCTQCRGQRTPSAIRKRFIPAVFWEREKIKFSTERVRLRKVKELETRTVENFKVKYFPKYSVTLEESFNLIRNYRDKNNWSPDIIQLDYIDIFKSSIGNVEMTWQDYDHMWKLTSGFAQEMDALIITADQTTKAGRTSRLLDHTSTPQASTKDHHVDLKIGLSKIEDETMNNICRTNIIYHRHRPFNRNIEVLITQNLTFGHAIRDSVFWFDKKMPPYPITLPEMVIK